MRLKGFGLEQFPRKIVFNLLFYLIISFLLTSGLCLCQDSVQLTGNSENVTQPETNVSITKIIEGTTIKYNIKTPIVDDFEVILALDSSGSFGLGGDELESGKKAVMYAVPRFLDYAEHKRIEENLNFRIAVIGWNNKVDFAYGGINNKNPSNASLVPIESAMDDVEDLLKNNYNPTEDKHTDFSTAVRASLDIFDNHPPREYNRTSRFIILVTGASEFDRCSPELIDRINNTGIKIYSVGIKVSNNPKSMMYEHLEEISGPKRITTVRAPVNEDFVRQSLNDLLSAALNETLDKAINEPPGHNVRFVESLYSYLIPKSVTVNGRPIAFDPIYNENDGTYTVRFNIEEGLPANALTDVAINCDLDVKNLPVSITKDRRPVTLCSPASSTPSSEVSYNWLQIKRPIHRELPENQMNINNRYHHDDQIASPVRPPTTTALLLRILDRIWL